MTETNLQKVLVHALPAYVKDPFSEEPRIDVPKLRVALKMSHEGVYRWLRENRLNPRAARNIVNLAADEKNKKVLDQLGRALPRVEDFSRFVFA